MKSGKIFFYLLLPVMFLLISACSDEKEKADYSGVSDLLAERNKARMEAGKKSSEKKQPTQKKVNSQSVPSSGQPGSGKDEKISSVVLYQQDIEIVGTDSGKKLARGIAYINKQGQIVRIKIIRK